MKDNQLHTVVNRHVAQGARLKVPVRRNFLQALWFFYFERSARSTVIMRTLALYWASVKDKKMPLCNIILKISPSFPYTPLKMTPPLDMSTDHVWRKRESNYRKLGIEFRYNYKHRSSRLQVSYMRLFNVCAVTLNIQRISHNINMCINN